MLAAAVTRLGSTFQPDLWTRKEWNRYLSAILTAARSALQGFSEPCGFTVILSCPGNTPVEAEPGVHVSGCSVVASEALAASLVGSCRLDAQEFLSSCLDRHVGLGLSSSLWGSLETFAESCYTGD